MLRDFVAEYPELDVAWLWLAAVAETHEERLDALRQAVYANPQNQQARIALAQLGEEPPIIAGGPPAAEYRDPATQPFWRRYALLLGLIGVLVLGSLFFLGQIIGSTSSRPPLVVTQLPSPTESPTTTQTATITLTPSITASPGPSPTPYIQPTLPPSWTPSATFTASPSFTPRPTNTPSPTASASPSATARIRLTQDSSDDAPPDATEESRPDND